LSLAEDTADHDWLTTREAARALSVTWYVMLTDHIKSAVRHKPGSRAGISPRGAGWRWYRPDIDDLLAFRRDSGLRTGEAARALNNLRAANRQEKA
jgi:hypothetical protein